MNNWIEDIGDDKYKIHLGEIFLLMLRNMWAIILAALFLGGGALAYSFFYVTPLYQSSIKMYVNNSTNASDATVITSSDITASQNLVATYSVVLTSKPTLDAVIEQIDLDYSYEELCSMISTETVNDTGIFKVTVTSADAAEAAEIANAIAEIAPDQIMEVVSGSSVKIVEYASVATEKSSPNRAKYALLGAVLGVCLSCSGILLSSLFRNGMSVEEKIRRDFQNLSVLSSIPLMEKRKSGKKKDKTKAEEADLCEHLGFAAAESYKLLRENIYYCLSDVQTCRVIGVTSSVRSEGKSTTSINLAYTLALASKKVCLIDCDFRIPSVSKSLQLQRKPGMTNFLISQADAADVLQRYVSGSASFYVISAGDTPPNPSELLGSKRMQHVLNALEKSFDYLILDLPPVGVVSDALTIAKSTDGMLFVVREDFYEKRVLRESLRIMEAVDTKLLGLVVTHSTAQEKEYKRYGGKYSSRYGYDTDKNEVQFQEKPVIVQPQNSKPEENEAKRQEA